MKLYKSVGALTNHRSIRFPSNEKKFSCDHCEYKTNNKLHLAAHIQAKHLPRDPNVNKCKKCGKSYSYKSDLVRHSKFCGQKKKIQVFTHAVMMRQLPV